MHHELQVSGILIPRGNYKKDGVTHITIDYPQSTQNVDIAVSQSSMFHVDSLLQTFSASSMTHLPINKVCSACCLS